MPVRAYVVLEVFGDEDPRPIGHHIFVSAPRVGEVVALETEGRRIYADITSVIHSPVADGVDVEPDLQLAALIRPEGEPN